MTNRDVFNKIFHRPVFEDARCEKCSMLLPCGACEWWDKEYADSEEKKPSFKIFISQPMKGRTDEEIMQERDDIMAKWTNKSVEFIDSYFNDDVSKSPVDSIGKSISLMGDADLVVFAPGWENARGCKVEHQVAGYYGIPVSYF